MNSFQNIKRTVTCGIVLAGLLLAASAAQAQGNARVFDWTQHGVITLVRDQGDSENCWAVAATEALEANWIIRFRQRVTLSPQPVLDRTHQNGADRLATAFDVLQKHGTALESSYPYSHKASRLRSVATPYRLAKWGFVNANASRPTVAHLKQALIAHGPLAVGVQVTQKFRSYKSGIFRETPNSADPNSIDHFVLLVGWDDSYGAWKIKNSWGTGWGESGYMRLTYNSVHVGSNAAWVECRR